MSSTIWQRATLRSVPQGARLLASSSSPTTIRKSKTGAPTISATGVDSGNASIRPSQRIPQSGVREPSLPPAEGELMTVFSVESRNDPSSSRGNGVSLGCHTTDTTPSTNDTIPSTTLPPTTSSTSQPAPDQPFPAPYLHKGPPLPPQSPITNWVLASPSRTAVLLKIGDWLGYGSPKQVAARRSRIIYTACSEVAEGPEQTFWYDTLSLPRTFQSWFTITNLHVWLVTVRLRALPKTHGRPFVQALIDHFFYDVEDRLRAVLGRKAPERLVTRHMKILREQWAGLGLACDLSLVTGDRDMASAMWRNLLGARGARGIAYPDIIRSSTRPNDQSESLHPTSLTSDPSSQPQSKPIDPSAGGVADFEGLSDIILLIGTEFSHRTCNTLGPAIDRYVLYPQLMLALTAYLRRELVRLERVSDTSILGGEGRGMRESVFGPEAKLGAEESAMDLLETFKFGSVKDAASKIGAELNSV